jgi:hypothetical protein
MFPHDNEAEDDDEDDDTSQQLIPMLFVSLQPPLPAMQKRREKWFHVRLCWYDHVQKPSQGLF